MRRQLTLSGIFTLGCFISTGCAPVDGENEALTSQDWTDAATGPDAGLDGGMNVTTLDGGEYDDEEDASAGIDASNQPPPVTPPIAPMTPDAGTTKPDAGTPDAGTTKPDAGTTKPDSGTPDAGTTKPDAGTPDAGTTKPDASTPDAGTTKPDAGTPDAGTTKPDASTPDAGTDPQPHATTFTEVYAIISEKCAFCHVADHIGLQLGHLDMSNAKAAYQNLVGQQAAGIDCGGTGEVRVMSGYPDKSLIIHKLEGTADCGVRMPDNFPPLSATQIEVIRSWIRAGAKND